MNKIKIFLALIQICLFATVSSAQPCANTNVTCTTLDGYITDPNMNGTWHRSHGAWDYSTNNAPTNATGGSLRMYSFMNLGSGVFTCHNFVQGQKYRVCFWVRNVSGWPGNFFGTLYVYAASGLQNHMTAGNIPSVSKQLIDDSYWGPGNHEFSMSGVTAWKFVTATFTANANWNQLWFYPKNPAGLPPPGPVQFNYNYVVEIDDIRVVEEPTPSFNFTVTDNTGGSPIDGCTGTAQLTLNGIPSSGIGSGAVATWSVGGTVLGTGTTLNVKPCSTTTYKVEITDQSASCPSCIRETIYHTVEVDQWSDPARLIYPTGVLNCTLPFDLEYDDPLDCANFTTYTWVEPDGITTHTGNPVTVPAATAFQTGEWTLRIWNTFKGCNEELKFPITVGTCCKSFPDFTVSGCNPIQFNNIGTGITYHVGTVWNFGDGHTANIDNPVHTYNVSVPTTFTVCLTTLYEDGQGESCCDRLCKPVQACPNTSGCVVTANYSSQPVWGWGNKIDFTDLSSGNGTICSYQWDFGDGTVISTTAPVVSHTYSIPGPWWVCLTVTNCVYDAGGNLIATCTDKKCGWVYPPDGKMGSHSAGDNSLPSAQQQATRSPMSANVKPEYNVLTAYPNPNDGNFTLSLRKRTGTYQVIVTDKLRKELYNSTHVFGKDPVKISLHDLPNGVYSVEVINERERFVEQISIVR